MIIIQVERTPLHTPSSPPLSCYAVAAPLLSSDEDEEEEEDEDDEDDEDENEKFVEDSDADPMSRWAFLFSTELQLLFLKCWIRKRGILQTEAPIGRGCK